MHTDSSLKLWVVMARATQSVSERLRGQVESHGLTFTEFAVLEVLYHKGTLPIGEVGGRVLLTSGSMTYVIDKLERRALIRRRSCESDRRIIYAELTEDGRALMNCVFPEHAAAVQEAIGALTENEKKTLIDLLKRVGLNARQALTD